MMIRTDRRSAPRVTMIAARQCGAERAAALVCGCVLVCTPMMLGCSYTVTIYVDEFINTKAHRTGQPLSLDIVCLMPADLAKDSNRGLRPDADIRADEWFMRKPSRDRQRGAEDRDRTTWDIPARQIYSFASGGKNDVYGTLLGGQLRGRNYTKSDFVRTRRVHHPAPLASGSLIYIFAGFNDADGSVLPTKPAVVDPTWHKGRKIDVEIGTKEFGDAKEPFIRVRGAVQDKDLRDLNEDGAASYEGG